MNLLLDTHVFLWFVTDDRQLSKAALDAIVTSESEIFLSPASYWEMAIKVQLGKYQLHLPFREFIEKAIDIYQFRIVPISPAHAAKVDGIKISLLDKDKEIAMRARLPKGVRMYTGDDFNFAELIETGSDALLGIFDAIAPAASAALGALAQGDAAKFHAILGPTVPLSRHIFQAPTRFYKTGVVFMAWLNGHQSHFTMVGGQQSTRSLAHFAELFRLADRANLLEQPELAVRRMTTLLALHGVE